MLKEYKTGLLLLLTGFLLMNSFGAKALNMKSDTTKEDEEVLFEVDANNKNGIFTDDNTIGYKVKLKSTYKENQDGTLTYDVLTDDGKPISTNQFPIHLKYHANENYGLTIPKKEAGFYRLVVKINTSSRFIALIYF